jgi:hypothetical protein
MAAPPSADAITSGHLAGDQILVLHREDRQLDADHPSDFARPQAAGVDDMLRVDVALVGDHVPRAVGALRQRLHVREAIDLGALVARAFA